MAKKKRIRGFFKSLFNFKMWFAVKDLKSGANLITSLSGSFFDSMHPQQVKHEQFEQTIKDQGLTEQQVQQAKDNYFRNAVMFLVLGVIFAINSIYLLSQYMLLPSVVSFSITIMTFIFSLKSHFWYFQIKNRKLGCTLKEWYHDKVS